MEPVPPQWGGGKSEPKLDDLTNIVEAFNHLFGSIEWNDEDKIQEVITEEIPANVNQKHLVSALWQFHRQCGCHLT